MINIQISRDSKTKLLDAKIAIVKHVLSSKKTRDRQAKDLGCSKRVLNSWIKKYKELNEYKKETNVYDGNEAFKQLDESNGLWKTKEL